MKRILFLFVIILPLVFASCSKDDDEKPLTTSAIIGNWSTGTDGIHKYISFESDGKGFYALFNGGKMGQNYLFNYTVSEGTISIKITYSETSGIIDKIKLWNCKLYDNRLIIENETEKGTYKKVE